MFDIGFQELVMIFVVALVVVGPKRLPELGKTLGKQLGELKKALDSVKAQVNAEMKEIAKEDKNNDPICRPVPSGSAMPNMTAKSELTPGVEEA